MKNYEKIKIFLLGFSTALLLIILISATNGDDSQSAIGKYQVEVSNSKLVILNTVTGEYIMDNEVIYAGKANKQRFRKGKFDDNYSKATEHSGTE